MKGWQHMGWRAWLGLPDLATGQSPSIEHRRSVGRSPVVYYCFDASGALLYIGHTCLSLTHRLRGHVNNSASAAWIGLVRRVRFDEFPSDRVARRYEAMAIHQHRPAFNKQHNPDWKRSAA